MKWKIKNNNIFLFLEMFVFIDTIVGEYKNDRKVYLATICGGVVAVANIIIMVANYSVSNFYDTFHIAGVFSFISPFILFRLA